MATLQDFSLIKTYVDRYMADYNTKKSSFSFLYLCLDLLLSLQPDEMDESQTEGGADRGIDAVYIDESDSMAKIHIFNCKYTEKFEKIKNAFPSNEIDKLLGIIRQIMDKDIKLKKEINPRLYEKVKNIWNIFDTQNPKFIIYLCSNLENNLISTEQERFEREIAKYSNFQIKYFNIANLVDLLSHRGLRKIDGELKMIDTNFFAKIDGNIRALIGNIDAEELLKLATNKFQGEIVEDVFNDNIRLFLKYRSRINKNIKETALLDDNYKFFYFNNGLTLTCDKFAYEERRAPIVKLTNVQIVNGGQTVHALYDAYADNPEIVKGINVLVRIYETTDKNLSQDIAEYTNSQNPVKNRDIRANDYVQKKLEKELLGLNYYYERKKGFYKDKPKEKRLDSEKIGQILMAFYNDMPGDAKNKKRLIFEDKFEEIFNDNVTASKVLFAHGLYNDIEHKKNVEQKKIAKLKSEVDIEKRSFIFYSTYYILYVLKKLAIAEGVILELPSKQKIINLYSRAIGLIKKFIVDEKKKNLKYSHSEFFKGNKLKKIIDDYFNKA